MTLLLKVQNVLILILKHIEISEKHFTYDISLVLTEEEYNLVNSDIRYKVSCGEIKEAILNCYRKKEGK